jgi:glycosyltransferase involved in cell wall biosynthesis
MFTTLFASSLAATGLNIKEFSFRNILSFQVVIFHWPNSFLSASSGGSSLVMRTRLKLLELARRLVGLKVVWVAHNVRPHDARNVSPESGADFLQLLDGVIYLSNSSRAEVLKAHSILSAVPSLVTTHGHYRSIMTSPPRLPRPLATPIRLLHFGNIRPYKNVELLVSCVRALPAESVHLTVVGKADDADLNRTLRDLANGADHIELDLRPDYLSEVHLEAILDQADAVVLPYKDILNSGTALFSLSRNRPLLAPRIGSLPELQETAGKDWVHLYEGDLTTGRIEAFLNDLGYLTLRSPPDLSANEWSRIGPQVAGFLKSLTCCDRKFESVRAERWS